MIGGGILPSVLNWDSRRVFGVCKLKLGWSWRYWTSGQAVKRSSEVKCVTRVKVRAKAHSYFQSPGCWGNEGTTQSLNGYDGSPQLLSVWNIAMVPRRCLDLGQSSCEEEVEFQRDGVKWLPSQQLLRHVNVDMCPDEISQLS